MEMQWCKSQEPEWVEEPESVRREEGPGLKPLCLGGGFPWAEARCYSGSQTRGEDSKEDRVPGILCNINQLQGTSV